MIKKYANVKLMHGFTIIETLVVIVIMGLIAVFAVPNLSKFNSSEDSKRELNDLTETLRQAQTNAQNGVKCNSSATDTTASSLWRIVFNSATQYTLQTICDDVSKTVGSNSKAATSLKNITLSLNCAAFGINTAISFSSITLGSSKVVYPDVSFCNAVSSQPYTITATSVNTNDVFTIIIDKGGAIYAN